MLHTGFGHTGSFILLLVLLLSSACQGNLPAAGIETDRMAASPTSVPTQRPSATAFPAPLEFNGKGAQVVELGPWQGPAIFHITAEQGSQPVKITLQSGLDLQTLVESTGAVDEYRGYSFPSTGSARMEIQGDRNWKVTVLPPSDQYFPVIEVPGEYSSEGSAVVLLEGEHSIAIFDTQDLEDITAWAFGPDGAGGPLSFKKEGAYRGRAVLPKTAEWIIVSAEAPWTVEVQLPCCEPPDYSADD